MYSGLSNSFRVTNLDPYTEYTFNVQIFLVENNEKSEMSDSVQVQTEEALPSEPQNLKVIGVTTSLMKFSWEVPLKPNGVLKTYLIYKDEVLVEETKELAYVINGLKASTTYNIQVYATNSVGRSTQPACLNTSTCSLGDITPEKPTFGMIGRREILVRWLPPQVITGKLNRYELNLNGKCVYSGILLECQVGMLKPDTEYKFDVRILNFFF